MSYLGKLFQVADLEWGAVEHWKKWEETYLAEVERVRELDPRQLPKMRSYSVKNELDKFPEEQTPAMVVVSPGMRLGTPQKEGDGTYSAIWDVGIAVVSSARDEKSTDALRGMYGASIRACFLQHPKIADGMKVEDWQDESYRDIPVDGDRTISVVQSVFGVRVFVAVEVDEGTIDPLEDPYQDYEHPSAEKVTADIKKFGDEL